MSDPLVTYLHDHLAGSVVAVKLLEELGNEHGTEPLGRFAAELLADIEADRAVLLGITERLGSQSSLVKDAAAWIQEKVSRLKLRRDEGHGLGTFEALEFLSLGILGKRALWRALAVIAPEDSRLGGVDFNHLVERAEAQHEKAEHRRLEVARTALRPVLK